MNIKKTNEYLIFITEFFPYGTGEAFIENEMPHLSESFENVIIIVLTPLALPQREVPGNVKVVNLNRPPQCIERLKAFFSLPLLKEIPEIKLNCRKFWFALSYLGKVFSIRSKIKQVITESGMPYDKFTIYSYWLSEGAMAASMICDVRKKISRAHRFDLYVDGNPFNYQPFQKRIIKKIDTVHPCSNNGTEYLKKLYPEFKDKIQTSYLGTSKIAESAKKETSDFFTIVSCSSITETKRVGLIVKSLAQFYENYGITFKWIHIGDGPLKELVLNAAQVILPKNSFNFRGNVSNSKVHQFYADHSIDCLINLSSSEGLPVSIMEAVSYGIPIIATNVGGTGEIVNEKTGKLLSNNPEIEEVTRALHFFASISMKEKETFSQNCKKYWADNFSSGKNYKIFLKQLLKD